MSYFDGNNPDNILQPDSGKARGIVLVIASSIPTANSLKEYLHDLNYAVAGPFHSTDLANLFLNRYNVNAVIFDSNTTKDEMITMNRIVSGLLDKIPLLVISNSELPFSYHNTHFISSPANPSVIDEKLTGLLSVLSTDDKSNLELINFINKIFEKILYMCPDIYTTSVRAIMEEGLQRFTHRNSSFLKKSKENLSLVITQQEKVDIKNFGSIFKFTLDELIEEINQKESIDWAESLIYDSIQATMLQETMNPNIFEMLTLLGVDVSKFTDSMASITPDFEEEKNEKVVFSILLGDGGPQLGIVVASNDHIKADITDATASQILTLVGQGSEYHQGIFGPLPIPSSKNMIAVICSKMVSSAIRDIRMRGQSLNVVAVGFRNELINCLPSRNRLIEVFRPFQEINNQNMLTEDLLIEISTLFNDSLKC